MVDLLIPKTSLETLKITIRAYNISYSPDGLTLDEISRNTGYPKSQLTRSNTFLMEISVLNKIDNKYKLFDSGRNYIELLENNDNEAANLQLKEILLSYIPIDLIINFVRLYKQVTKDQLEQRIIELSDSNVEIWDHKAGINCLIEMLIESKIIDKTNNYYSLNDSIEN